MHCIVHEYQKKRPYTKCVQAGKTIRRGPARILLFADSLGVQTRPRHYLIILSRRGNPRPCTNTTPRAVRICTRHSEAHRPSSLPPHRVVNEMKRVNREPTHAEPDFNGYGFRLGPFFCGICRVLVCSFSFITSRPFRIRLWPRTRSEANQPTSRNAPPNFTTRTFAGSTTSVNRDRIARNARNTIYFPLGDRHGPRNR